MQYEVYKREDKKKQKTYKGTEGYDGNIKQKN